VKTLVRMFIFFLFVISAKAQDQSTKKFEANVNVFGESVRLQVVLSKLELPNNLPVNFKFEQTRAHTKRICTDHDGHRDEECTMVDVPASCVLRSKGRPIVLSLFNVKLIDTRSGTALSSFGGTKVGVVSASPTMRSWDLQHPICSPRKGNPDFVKRLLKSYKLRSNYFFTPVFRDGDISQQCRIKYILGNVPGLNFDHVNINGIAPNFEVTSLQDSFSLQGISHIDIDFLCNINDPGGRDIGVVRFLLVENGQEE